MKEKSNNLDVTKVKNFYSVKLTYMRRKTEKTFGKLMLDKELVSKICKTQQFLKATLKTQQWKEQQSKVSKISESTSYQRYIDGK